MFARRALAMLLVAAAIALGAFAHVSGDAPARRSPYSKKLPPGDAVPLIEEKCLLCHSAMLIAQQHKDSTGWEKTVTQMETWGARILPADHGMVVSYLVKNFGPRTAK